MCFRRVLQYRRTLSSQIFRHPFFVGIFIPLCLLNLYRLFGVFLLEPCNGYKFRNQLEPNSFTFKMQEIISSEMSEHHRRTDI